MRKMSLRSSLLLMGIVLAIIMIPSLVFGSKVQPLFLAAWSAAAAVLTVWGFSWDDLMEWSSRAWQKGCSPILFLLCAGAMIGAWNACGTIPLLTLVGVSHMDSRMFLLLSFAGCLLFGLLTGTVFGVCGTVGIMFLAVGRSLNIPESWSVSAVACGAFFGYGLSPLADCTNLTASSARVPLSSGVLCQIPVVLPVLAALTVLFAWRGSLFPEMGMQASQLVLTQEIRDSFRPGIWPALPPVLAASLLLLRKPAMLSLLAGAAAGGLVSCLYQGNSLGETIAVIWQGADFSGRGEMLQNLFGGGGMTGMSGTAVLFLLAFGLFGILDGCGAVRAVTGYLLAAARTPRRAAVITVLFGFGLNVICASAMCSFIFTLSCLMPLYEEEGWERSALVRSSFVGCLYMSFLIPWHSNIMTASSLLGVEEDLLWTEMAAPVVTVGILFLLFCAFLKREEGTCIHT